MGGGRGGGSGMMGGGGGGLGGGMGMMGNMGGSGGMMGNMGGGGGGPGITPQLLQQLGVDGPVTNTVFVSNVSFSIDFVSAIVKFGFQSLQLMKMWDLIGFSYEYFRLITKLPGRN